MNAVLDYIDDLVIEYDNIISQADTELNRLNEEKTKKEIERNELIEHNKLIEYYKSKIEKAKERSIGEEEDDDELQDKVNKLEEAIQKVPNVDEFNSLKKLIENRFKDDKKYNK